LAWAAVSETVTPSSLKLALSGMIVAISAIALLRATGIASALCFWIPDHGPLSLFV
jgi:uncharacterized membrane protein YqhA